MRDRLANPNPQSTILAIDAFVPGQNYPVWKLAFSNAQTLRNVIRCWANARLGTDLSKEVPAGAKAFTEAEALDLDDVVGNLRKKLKVRQGALSLTVAWPPEALPAAVEAAAAAARAGSRAGPKNTARGKLKKLHPSSRYCHVDRKVMGWGTSSTHMGKIRSGTYSDTRGHYPEAELASTMRQPPSRMDYDVVELESQVLAAFDEQHELFRTRLTGPPSLMRNWEATCRRFEQLHLDIKADMRSSLVPFPVFIPSRGRPEKAHLNWEAEHVFGKPRPDVPAGSWPVVCVVVEPQEEEEYRRVWSDILMLVLPESSRGAGYARWVVQHVCTKAFVAVPGQSINPLSADAQLRRLGRIWIADDTLTMIYRLDFMEISLEDSQGRFARPRRLKNRVVGDGPIFWEAMLAVQKHPFLPRAAVAGFLRDDGTAVCKRNEWKQDELALYKIVLLNLMELCNLGVAYLPDLQMYEDICLNHDVLSKGGRTLKCQCYGFRAVHPRKGGCLQQRRSKHDKPQRTRLNDLMKIPAFKSLDKDRRHTVQQLLEWVRDKEQKFQTKAMAFNSKEQKFQTKTKSAQAPDGQAASSDHKPCEDVLKQHASVDGDEGIFGNETGDRDEVCSVSSREEAEASWSGKCPDGPLHAMQRKTNCQEAVCVEDASSSDEDELVAQPALGSRPLSWGRRTVEQA
eukprot:TRINITY_DN6304_c0_g2_i1.p1 TRINITY_DN6304_c0_g2~~TRINITY_DN6304_c0_g2_i1.p1  ORF type:complete len:683 (-),score=119.03 TRINITY_DN6304_c0_g2_i1:216-2264(-)